MKANAGKHNNNFTGARWLICAGCLAVTLWAGTACAENSPPLTTEPAATVAAASAATVAAAPDTDAVPAAGTAPASAIPAYKPALPSAAKTSTTSQLANLIGGLAFILVLIYGLSWFVKRFTQGGFMQNSSIKMLASLPLGTRERLMLVEVGGKQILLGVTAAQINSLHVFEEQVVQTSDSKADSATVPAASDFSQKLMAILQQKTSGKTDSSHHKNIK